MKRRGHPVHSRRIPKRDHARRLPVSSHPDVEAEIQHSGGGLDPAQLHLAPPLPEKKPKPIVSIHGRDIDSSPRDKAA